MLKAMVLTSDMLSTKERACSHLYPLNRKSQSVTPSPHHTMLSDFGVYDLMLLAEKGERGGGIARRTLYDFWPSTFNKQGKPQPGKLQIGTKMLSRGTTSQ